VFLSLVRLDGVVFLKSTGWSRLYLAQRLHVRLAASESVPIIKRCPPIAGKAEIRSLREAEE
jgi:hypothetical protein